MSSKYHYIENYMFPCCDESSKYEKVSKIGQGTFGLVTSSCVYLSTSLINSVHIQGSVQGSREELDDE